MWRDGLCLLSNRRSFEFASVHIRCYSRLGEQLTNDDPEGGRIFQITLNENGTAPAHEPVELFRSENRYRDIAFGPDGRTLYVITDMRGPVQAMKEGPITPTTALWSPGSLLVFRYER